MAEPIVVRHGGDGVEAARRRGAPARRVSAGRIALSLFLAFAPPLIAYFALGGGGSLAWIIAFVALVEASALFRYVRGPRGVEAGPRGGKRETPRTLARVETFAPWLSRIMLLLGALVIFAGIDITPASDFLAWFALVAHGSAGGTIGYLFAVMFAYFSALFSSLVLAGDALFALLALLAADLFLCGVILGRNGFEVAAAILFLGALLSLAGQRLGRISARSTIAVIQVTLVTALAALPLSNLIARNRLIDSLFAVELNGIVSGLFPNFPFLYSVPGYGSSFASTLLGETPDLTSRPVFLVSGPPGATIYLRTAVYDIYNGTGWKLSTYERKRGELAAYFYDYGPRYMPPSATKTITVKLLADFYSRLPNTLDTIGYQFANGEIPGLRYGSLASGFTLQTPMTKGSIVTDVIDNSPRPHFSPGFIEHYRFFGQRSGPYGDAVRRPPPRAYFRGRAEETSWTDGLPNWLRSASLIPSRYSISPREERIDLQTGALPAQVVDLARSLLRPTEGATVRAIRNYLKDNYLYSLTTRAAGPAGDTVDDFLFHSRTGYCVQFATAFVILARLDGIPSRYITGFLVYLPSNATSTVVTGLSAHAWAEVWSPRNGWETEEATPPMLASAFSDPQFYARFNPTDSGVTQQELEAVLGNRVPVQIGHQTPRVRRLGAHRSSLPAAAAMVPVVLLLAFAGLLARRRLAPSEVRLARVVAKIARRSRSRKLPDPSQRGWSAWAEAFALRHPARRAVTLRAGDVILQRYFSGAERNGRDLRFLESFYRWGFGSRRAHLRRALPASVDRSRSI